MSEMPACMMPDGGDACPEYHKAMETIVRLTRERDEARETVARWVISLGFATGHGDTLQDILAEAGAHIRDTIDLLVRERNAAEARREHLASSYTAISDENDRLSDRIRDVEGERDEARSRYKSEYEIVNRIWQMLGNPPYGDLAGRSIYDLISEVQARALAAEAREAKLREAGDSLYAKGWDAGWAAATSALERALADRVPIIVREVMATAGARAALEKANA